MIRAWEYSSTFQNIFECLLLAMPGRSSSYRKPLKSSRCPFDTIEQQRWSTKLVPLMMLLIVHARVQLPREGDTQAGNFMHAWD